MVPVNLLYSYSKPQLVPVHDFQLYRHVNAEMWSSQVVPSVLQNGVIGSRRLVGNKL